MLYFRYNKCLRTVKMFVKNGKDLRQKSSSKVNQDKILLDRWSYRK